MKYSFIGVFTQNLLDADLQIGEKSEWINVNVKELTLPRKSTLTQEIRKDSLGTERIWLSLYGENILDEGTFGFVVSSPQKDIEPITFVFGIKGKPDNNE